MADVTAIIITKNSAETLAKTIESVFFCKRVLIIDAGSTDDTVAIAKKHRAEVITGVDNDFAKQRNIGLKHTKTPWVLYVDSDEIVTKELSLNIQDVTKREDASDAYLLKRRNYYLGNHRWPQEEEFLRLFKTASLKGWTGALHETAQIQGEAGRIEGVLEHFTHRDLSSMLAKTNEWSAIEAKLRFEGHHPKMVWWRFFRVFITGFTDSFIKQKGWKAGTAGLIESMYQGFSLFITYAKLWEMQQHEKSH